MEKNRKGLGIVRGWLVCFLHPGVDRIDLNGLNVVCPYLSTASSTFNYLQCKVPMLVSDGGDGQLHEVLTNVPSLYSTVVR